MTADLPKTRKAAIDHLMGLSYSVAQEFCCSTSESDRVDAEARAALRLLGVTDAEIDADEQEGA